MSLDITAYATQWYTILAGTLLVYGLTRYIQKQRFIIKHGCKEPRKQRSSLFALDLIYQLLNAKREGRLVDFCTEVISNVGDTFYIRLLGIRIVLTIEPENMKAILATQFNDYALGKRHTFFKPLLGDGIFTLDGSGWKHSRAMLRPQFARDQVAHVKALEPHLQILAKHIKNAKGKTFDLQELFFNFTVDTASEFLFGESFNALHTPEVSDKKQISLGNASFAESFNKAQTYLSTRSYLQDFYWLVSPKDFHDACANVHQFARYYVNKALSFTPEELEENSKDGYVFLYELVKQTRDPIVLQDQLLNILVAGRDTTAGLLSFIFFELARNPEIFAKLKDEIYTNFGSGDDADIEAITFESLKKCEYLKFVINEALRLYPSVPINFRVATKETTLPRGGGKDGQSPVYIAKGTTVGYSVYATHRMEEYYGKDANEFRPERWANLNKLGWAYLPFNGGPRICLGQQFALTEASYVVTRLIQMFPNLSTKDKEYPPKKCVHLTMSHHTGVFVQMT